MTEKPIATFLESYFEYRADFRNAMFNLWTIPNKLLETTYPLLRNWGVDLSDVSFTKDPANLKEAQLTLTVTKLNAIIRIGIDQLVFVAINPNWAEAGSLIELFEASIQHVKKIGNSEVFSQELVLAMHIQKTMGSFQSTLTGLVNTKALGDASMYGVSVYRDDASIVFDKSLKYQNALFLRLHRKFGPEVLFPQIAETLYRDELDALKMVGLGELIPDGDK